MVQKRTDSEILCKQIKEGRSKRLSGMRILDALRAELSLLRDVEGKARERTINRACMLVHGLSKKV